MSEIITGVTIKLNGQDYILPPLNLDALEQYWEKIQGWAQAPESLMQRLSEVAEVLHAALARNYPDLALTDLKKGLDLRNFATLVEALLQSSGLARVEPGEPAAGSAPTLARSAPESPRSRAGRGRKSAKI